MNIKYTFKNIDGYCPYLDGYHSIKSKYSVTETLSQPTLLRHIVSSCTYSNECSMLNECPLKQKAKQIQL